MNNPADKTIQTFDQIKNKVIDFSTDYGFQIVGALIIVAVGLFLAGWLGRLMKRWLSKKDIEPPVRMLAVRVVRLVVVGLTLVIALDKCGVPIAPMIAGISVVGVGVGLAVQGVLGNLVAGLNIIFTKPFRIGEYIEIAGVQGQVTLIELFSTTLQHSDQSLIVIPNKQIVGEILRNYGYIRQLNLTVGVSYGTDINAAVALVGGVLERNPRVLSSRLPAWASRCWRIPPSTWPSVRGRRWGITARRRRSFTRRCWNNSAPARLKSRSRSTKSGCSTKNSHGEMTRFVPVNGSCGTIFR